MTTDKLVIEIGENAYHCLVKVGDHPVGYIQKAEVVLEAGTAKMKVEITFPDFSGHNIAQDTAQNLQANIDLVKGLPQVDILYVKP
jgi:hypothetical protein